LWFLVWIFSIRIGEALLLIEIGFFKITVLSYLER
jgi:hypothetical protein